MRYIWRSYFNNNTFGNCKRDREMQRVGEIQRGTDDVSD